MTSIIKVDTLQTAAGGVPTASDLGINTTDTIVAAYTTLSSMSAQTSATTSFIDITGLSITLTPKSAANTILIGAVIAAETHGSHADKGIRFNIYRGGTAIYGSEYDLYNSDNAAQRITKSPLMFLENAASTSSRTYKISFSSTRTDSNANARVNNYGEPSTMYIFEIAG
mgnify:CR=1 FL=1